MYNIESFGIIEFNSTACMMNRVEPDDYVSEFSGKIISAMDEEVGIIEGKVFNVRNVRLDNRDMIETSDSSMELEEYISYIWDYDANTFKEHIAEELVDNIVIIDKVLIKPQYSGNKFALSAIRATVNHWAGGSDWLVLLKAAPLQHCLKTSDELIEQFDLGRFHENETVATSKLIQHYGEIGFECIDDSNFMYVNGMCKSAFDI
jgi:hypothetical protein